jgi:hypothetical protein
MRFHNSLWNHEVGSSAHVQGRRLGGTERIPVLLCSQRLLCLLSRSFSDCPT